MKPRKKKVASRTARKSVKEWLGAARAERNAEQAEAVYSAGLAEWPRSAHLLIRAAGHRWGDFDDRAAAESLFRRAFAAQPRNHLAIESLTEFLCEKPDGWKEAAEIYRAMLRRNPRDLFALRRLAFILTDHPRDLAAAERLLRRSVRIAPRDPSVLRELAYFLLHTRKDPDAAERIHRRVLRLRPVRPHDITHYADFLRDARGDYDAAERHYRQACAHPRAKRSLRMALGLFLIIYRGRYGEGEALLAEGVSEERKAAAGSLAGIAVFDAFPATREEWIHQMDWSAVLAQFDPDSAERYALLKAMRPEFFPEDR